MFEGSYNTLGNICGMGEVMPPEDGCMGSGDKFTQTKKVAKKKQASKLDYGTPLPTVVYATKK